MASLALGRIGKPVSAPARRAAQRACFRSYSAHDLVCDRIFDHHVSAHRAGRACSENACARTRGSGCALDLMAASGVLKVFQWPIRLLGFTMHGRASFVCLRLHPERLARFCLHGRSAATPESMYRDGGHLESEEQQLIHKVFDFSDAAVKEAMAPRPQVSLLASDCDSRRRWARFFSRAATRVSSSWKRSGRHCWFAVSKRSRHGPRHQ